MSSNSQPYNSSSGFHRSTHFGYRRWITREVSVGNVAIGGRNPIRLQSMTQGDTMDSDRMFQECVALYEAGSELVRLTVPGNSEAENLKEIKSRLKKAGYDFPLVADIHFSQSAALIALEHVEKVRINPGNYADRRHFIAREYSENEYEAELERLHDAFRPLAVRARQLGRTLRIGSNHGSLSDRIINRYGDTPQGMVESALEFIAIAEHYDFYDMVISMKSSHPGVMQQAYQLLVKRMIESGRNYPLHLGVTEAGLGRDGRLKSIAGIAGLLEDGIGDTIRVSLTENPVRELPVARYIADRYDNWEEKNSPPGSSQELSALPYKIERSGKTTKEQLIERSDHLMRNLNISGSADRVTALTALRLTPNELKSVADNLLQQSDERPDFILLGDKTNGDEELLSTLNLAAGKNLTTPIVFNFNSASAASTKLPALVRGVELDYSLSDEAEQENSLKELAELSRRLELWPLINLKPGAPQNNLSERLIAFTNSLTKLFPGGCSIGVTLKGDSFRTPGHNLSLTKIYRELRTLLNDNSETGGAERYSLLYYHQPHDESDDLYNLALHGAGLLLDYEVNGLVMNHTTEESPAERQRLALDILQCSRLRMTRAEFISCPSCGRTKFDIETVAARIKELTAHLPGVKIAVMGCIVNGPGEMNDADFGYVGAAPGRVHLYRRQNPVKKNIPADEAETELVELLKEHGYWRDPTI